jgi:hypothetical protein
MNVTDKAFVYRVSKLTATIVLSFISVIILILFIWSIFIRGPVLIAFATLLLLVFLPLKLDELYLTVIKIGVLIASIVLIIIFSAFPIKEIQMRLNHWSYTLGQRGISGYTVIDKVAIYNTNLVYGIYAQFIGAPEFGKEVLRLCVPTSGSRIWSSSFAMKSPKVIGTLNNWIALLNRQKRNVSHYNLPARKISWNDYTSDRRVALALNPVILEAKASPVGDRWRLDCKATIRIKYRQDSERPLLTSKGKRLLNPGGPFWALQEIDWLHPYTAIWSWSIYSDDSRLSSRVL